MQYKKLLFSSIFFLGLGSIALLNMSSSSGQMGVYATGCSGTGCHAASSANTTIAVTGIPSTGYVAGTVYPVTLTVTNSDSNIQAGGFDLKFDGGTITNAPTNTMLMGLELHHTAPKSKSGNSVTWSFSWTAPTAASTILNVSANMVNGNTSESGDQWNKVTLTFNKATSSVASVSEQHIAVFPNPCANQLSISSTKNIQSIQVMNLAGQMSSLDWSLTSSNSHSVQVNTSTLSVGNYMAHLIFEDGSAEVVRFTKN